MRHNFLVLFKYSLLDKFKTKTFALLSVLLVIISFAVVIVPEIISNESDIVSIGVISNKEEDTTLFKSLFTEFDSRKVFETTFEKYKDEEFEYVIDLTNSIIYIASSHSIEQGELTQINLLLDNFRLQKIADTEFVDFNLVTYDDGQDGSTEGAVYAITYFIKFLAYFILIYGTSLLTPEIIEEKSSRQLEIVMCSVKPRYHLLSKILSIIIYLTSFVAIFALGLFIAIQVTPLIIDVEGTLFVKQFISQIFDSLSTDVISFAIYLLVLFIVTTVLFLMFVLTNASTYNSIEDVQSASSISILVVVASFFISLLVTDLEILKNLAYIPLLNFFIVPDLILSETVTMFNAIIYLLLSIVVLIIAVFGLSKVYRFAILNYSSKGILPVIKSMIKNSKK